MATMTASSLTLPCAAAAPSAVRPRARLAVRAAAAPGASAARLSFSGVMSAPVGLPKLAVAPRATRAPRAVSTQAMASGEIVEDADGFNIAAFSFGTIGAFAGIFMLTFGFGAFFELIPGGSISSLLLIYGFPITLIGFALKYAELKPVPCTTYKEAAALRDDQATNIQVQVKSDVTRFRYGDELHLDEALKRIFRFGQGGGIPRRYAPTLTAIREEAVSGNYSLVLVFAAPKITTDSWEDKMPKFTSFFGPGVEASYKLVGEGEDALVEVALTCDGSGAGREDVTGKTVLPPLAPGQQPREISK